MEIEAMKADLRELDAQANVLNNMRCDLRQKIADAQAVFKVGDNVTYDGAKYVWQITGIGVSYNNDPKYIGAKIKKDGKPGVATSGIWIPYKAVLVLHNVVVSGCAAVRST